MMRRIPAILYLVALLCLAMASCNNEPVFDEVDNETATVEPRFSTGTRANVLGNPQHGDAYTLVSYNVGGTSTAYTDKYQISSANQYGYYAYDDGAISGQPEGTFVPVAVSVPNVNDLPPFSSSTFYVPSEGINPLVMDRTKAQKLSPTPETGLSPNNNTGLYRTAVIHPAIPLYNAADGGLGYLPVYHIDTDVWASSPDDADGKPNTDDPFEIWVKTNREVYELPNPTELYPLKSLVNVSFYSEYFDDEDQDMEDPLSQEFTITSLKLVNVGSNGWYNARTGIVYPNYNYGPVGVDDAKGDWRTIYTLREKGVKTDGSPIISGKGTYNFVDLLDPNHDDDLSDSKIVDESPNNKKPPKRDGFPDPTKFIQWSFEIPVFPSDYRGGENGGLDQVTPLSLRMVLDVGEAQLKATVPIAIVMERGKRYNFYVNVMSELIGVYYSVSKWNIGRTDNEDDPNEIGGYDDRYFIEVGNIKYDHSKWQNGGGGMKEEIGD